MITANQDVHALTGKLSSISPISSFKLKLEINAIHLYNYMSTAIKKSKQVCEVKLKAKALWHFEVEAVLTFDD